MARLQIDKLDTKILQMLVDNGRKPFLEIARECGVSGAAIHQRIAKLQATNILEGSRALIKPTTLGYDTCAFVGIYLKEAASFDEIIEKLRTVPEVTEVHFTTGQYDMLVKLYARQRASASSHPRQAPADGTAPHRDNRLLPRSVLTRTPC